jgi:hypothetical protein
MNLSKILYNNVVTLTTGGKMRNDIGKRNSANAFKNTIDMEAGKSND